MGRLQASVSAVVAQQLVCIVHGPLVASSQRANFPVLTGSRSAADAVCANVPMNISSAKPQLNLCQNTLGRTTKPLTFCTCSAPAKVCCFWCCDSFSRHVDVLNALYLLVLSRRPAQDKEQTRSHNEGHAATVSKLLFAPYEQTPVH